MVTEKKTDAKQPWKKIYEVIDDEYFEKYDVEFLKEFLLKCKKLYNVLCLFLLK